MKKLILFVCVAATFSCSDDKEDQSSDHGTITVKVDGAQKTFNSVYVNTEYFPEDGGIPEYTMLNVEATIGGSDYETISFYTIKGETGENMVYDFTYTRAGETYHNLTDLYTDIEVNNDNKELRGSFYGEVGDEERVQFSEGYFDINY